MKTSTRVDDRTTPREREQQQREDAARELAIREREAREAAEVEKRTWKTVERLREERKEADEYTSPSPVLSLGMV